MNRKLLGLSLALSAVLASTNISSASERWVNTGTISTWGGQNYANIDITSAEKEQDQAGAGIYNSGTFIIYRTILILAIRLTMAGDFLITELFKI